MHAFNRCIIYFLIFFLRFRFLSFQSFLGGSGPILFYDKDQPYYEFTNFAYYPIIVDEQLFRTSEHYFWSQKLVGTPYEKYVSQLPTPKDAFEFSHQPHVASWVRGDWQRVKEDVMYKALYHKFSQYQELKELLLKTGDRKLVEHSPYDSYWGGGPDGKGLNRLGVLLMKLRDAFSCKHTSKIDQSGSNVQFDDTNKEQTETAENTPSPSNQTQSATSCTYANIPESSNNESLTMAPPNHLDNGQGVPISKADSFQGSSSAVPGTLQHDENLINFQDQQHPSTNQNPNNIEEISTSTTNKQQPSEQFPSCDPPNHLDNGQGVPISKADSFQSSSSTVPGTLQHDENLINFQDQQHPSTNQNPNNIEEISTNTTNEQQPSEQFSSCDPPNHLDNGQGLPISKADSFQGFSSAVPGTLQHDENLINFQDQQHPSTNQNPNNIEEIATNTTNEQQPSEQFPSCDPPNHLDNGQGVPISKADSFQGFSSAVPGTLQHDENLINFQDQQHPSTNQNPNNIEEIATNTTNEQQPSEQFPSCDPPNHLDNGQGLPISKADSFQGFSSAVPGTLQHDENLINFQDQQHPSTNQNPNNIEEIATNTTNERQPSEQFPSCDPPNHLDNGQGVPISKADSFQGFSSTVPGTLRHDENLINFQDQQHPSTNQNPNNIEEIATNTTNEQQPSEQFPSCDPPNHLDNGQGVPISKADSFQGFSSAVPGTLQHDENLINFQDQQHPSTNQNPNNIEEIATNTTNERQPSEQFPSCDPPNHLDNGQGVPISKADSFQGFSSAVPGTLQHDENLINFQDQQHPSTNQNLNNIEEIATNTTNEQQPSEQFTSCDPNTVNIIPTIGTTVPRNDNDIRGTCSEHCHVTHTADRQSSEQSFSGREELPKGDESLSERENGCAMDIDDPDEPMDTGENVTHTWV